MFSSKYAFGILSTELDMFIAKKKKTITDPMFNNNQKRHLLAMCLTHCEFMIH